MEHLGSDGCVSHLCLSHRLGVRPPRVPLAVHQLPFHRWILALSAGSHGQGSLLRPWQLAQILIYSLEIERVGLLSICVSLPLDISDA